MMLLLTVRVVAAITILVFLIGMHIGFGSGHGSRALRAILFASIMLAVGVAAASAWALEKASPWLVAPGAVLAVAGCVLFIWTMRLHPRRPDKAFAADAPPDIMTSGPYALARHPIYLSYLLAVAGVGLLTHSLALGAATVWLAVLYAHAARMEERLILASPHGARYAEYSERVGAFWPVSLKRRQ